MIAKLFIGKKLYKRLLWPDTSAKQNPGIILKEDGPKGCVYMLFFRDEDVDTFHLTRTFADFPLDRKMQGRAEAISFPFVGSGEAPTKPWAIVEKKTFKHRLYMILEKLGC